MIPIMYQDSILRMVRKYSELNKSELLLLMTHSTPLLQGCMFAICQVLSQGQQGEEETSLLQENLCDKCWELLVTSR